MDELVKKYRKDILRFEEIENKDLTFKEINSQTIDVLIEGKVYTTIELVDDSTPEWNFEKNSTRKVTEVEWNAINYWKKCDFVDSENEITYHEVEKMFK